jgi:vacuolar-type H+-ATPase subunit C/Vma6
MDQIDGTLVAESIRLFFPSELQEAAVANLQIRLDKAYLQGMLDMVQTINGGEDVVRTES